MAQVLIRQLDDDLVEDYRTAARQGGRSLEAELRALLIRMRPRTPERIADLVETARRIRAMTPDVPQTEGWRLIREDRDGLRDA